MYFRRIRRADVFLVIGAARVFGVAHVWLDAGLPLYIHQLGPFGTMSVVSWMDDWMAGSCSRGAAPAGTPWWCWAFTVALHMRLRAHDHYRTSNDSRFLVGGKGGDGPSSSFTLRLRDQLSLYVNAIWI